MLKKIRDFNQAFSQFTKSSELLMSVSFEAGKEATSLHIINTHTHKHTGHCHSLKNKLAQNFHKNRIPRKREIFLPVTPQSTTIFGLKQGLQIQMFIRMSWGYKGWERWGFWQLNRARASKEAHLSPAIATIQNH